MSAWMKLELFDEIVVRNHLSIPKFQRLYFFSVGLYIHVFAIHKTNIISFTVSNITEIKTYFVYVHLCVMSCRLQMFR